MIIWIIIIGLLAATYFLTIHPRRSSGLRKAYARSTAHDSQRDIISTTEWLAGLRETAKAMRCGDMTRPGIRACRRAAGRPCIRGCRGRIDIDPNWNG